MVTTSHWATRSSSFSTRRAPRSFSSAGSRGCLIVLVEGVCSWVEMGRTNLVVIVQKLFALKSLETPQDTLTDSPNTDSSNNLVLEIVFILGGTGDIPFTSLDLFMGRDEVADEGEDGHDNIYRKLLAMASKELRTSGLTFSDRHDVRACNFRNGDTAIGLVCSIKVDMVRADTSSNSELQLLGLCKTLGSQITRVETTAN